MASNNNQCPILVKLEAYLVKKLHLNKLTLNLNNFNSKITLNDSIKITIITDNSKDLITTLLIITTHK